MDVKAFLKRWRFTFILLASVMAGAAVGLLFGGKAAKLKPFGDIFLNLLFTAVVPLVFFSLSSAIAGNNNIKRLGKIASLMLIIFVITGIISSCVMLFAVKMFNPANGITLENSEQIQPEKTNLSERIVSTISVNNFSELLNRKNILALIIFSVLVGFASQAAGEKGETFRRFLVSGSEVMGKLIRIIMLYAPVGLGAYFAYLVGTFGSQILGSYARVVAVYYPAAIAYFIIAFSLYAFIGGGINGIKNFWKFIWPPLSQLLEQGAVLRRCRQI